YSNNGVGGVLGLVIYILISPVTYFIVPSEVRYMYEDLDGQKSPVRGIYGLWFLLPLIGSIIWFVQVQGALNRYWESKGAPAPSPGYGLRGVELAAPVDEPLCGGAELDPLDFADEDRVVARLVLRHGAAPEPADRTLDQRPARAVAHLDAVPERERRDPAA